MKLVISGGPCAGKSKTAEFLARKYGDLVALVPETATILFGGGFPRGQDPNGIRRHQRAIYFVQQELELAVIEKQQARLYICDRGTLDGPAYWPDTADSFFQSVGSTLEQEIARYQWVIHLDTVAKSHYNIDHPTRNEAHEEALELNNRIKTSWQNHPKHFTVESYPYFQQKLDQVDSIVNGIFNGLYH